MLGEAIRQGHTLGFVTLTMRHRQGQALDDLWAAASKAWGRATSGKAWVKAQKRHGVAGWVRVWEVTEGRNGWHVHVHLVVVLPPGASDDHLDAVARPMYERWSRGLQAAGLEAPMLAGQDWHLVAGDEAAEQVGEYLHKLVETAGLDRARSLGLELATTLPGRSRDALRTRPVWALLDDLVETGEASALNRWHEWERSSKGKRQVAYSKGFRERFGVELEDELTDDQVVDEEHGTAADDCIRWSSVEWRAFVQNPGRVADLLEAAEIPGPIGLQLVRSMLDGWGVSYSLVDAAQGAATARPMDIEGWVRPQSDGVAADAPPLDVHPPSVSHPVGTVGVAMAPLTGSGTSGFVSSGGGRNPATVSTSGPES